MSLLRLGTRASALAQTQARQVAQHLQDSHRGLRVELVLISTLGDRTPSPLVGEGGDGGTPSPSPSPTSGEGKLPGGLKAMFTKELEDALLDKRIDLAVHSLKDMAAEIPKGLVIGAVPEREDPRDAWISVDGTPFSKLPSGARVATGAIRRQIQLKHWRTDLEIMPMRGNVDTRLRKLKELSIHGLVLACAGLKRLGRISEMTEALPVAQMIPAIGQGCLAIESRENDASVSAFLETLNHAPSRAAADAERGFLKALGGNCQTPIAAHAEMNGARIHVTGWIGSLDGKKSWRQVFDGDLASAATVGETLAQRLLDAGAKI